MIIRPPVVAGSFYSLDRDMLRKQIDACFKHRLGPITGGRHGFTAAVVPHAGYEYSGAVAAWVYSRVEKTNYIILGPNHQGVGSNFAIMKDGMWKTPLGEVIIDRTVAEKILDKCKLVEYDILAHEYEHSVEVQLPFLQYKFGSDFKFVPLSIKNEFPDENFLEQCKIVGKCLAEVVKNQKDKWIVIASSDFSHYIPHELASDVDNYLIESILGLDEREFFDRISERNASVCGFGPIAVAMVAAKKLNVKKSELLKYSTSGDVTGDFGSVVGYASVVMY